MKLKRHIPPLFAGLLMTLLAACASSGSNDSCCCACGGETENKALPTLEKVFLREEDAIRQVLVDQVEAWNAGNIEGFMEGYWKSDELIFTSDGRIRRGWQAALDAYREHYTKDTMGKLSFSHLDIVLTADNEAVVLGRWQVSEVEGNPSGDFTLVFRRFVDGWRIIRDHTSSD